MITNIRNNVSASEELVRIVIRKSIEASEAYSYQFKMKIVVSGDKDVHIMDFLLSLPSCYLIPTVDKPMRVHRNRTSVR